MSKISINIGGLLIDEGQIISADIDHLSRGNLSDIGFCGVYSNRGRISFIDKGKLFKIKEREGDLLSSPILVSFYGTLVATFYIEDYEYDDETLLVELQLKDELLSFNDKEITGAKVFETKTLEDVLRRQTSLVSSRTDLRDIKIYCPYVSKTTLWDFVNKVCEASSSFCICNERGSATIYPRGVSSGNVEIPIYPKNIYKIIDHVKKEKTVVSSLNISALKIDKYSKRIPSNVPEVDVFDVSFEGYEANPSTGMQESLFIQGLRRSPKKEGASIEITDDEYDNPMTYREIKISSTFTAKDNITVHSVSLENPIDIFLRFIEAQKVSASDVFPSVIFNQGAVAAPKESLGYVERLISSDGKQVTLTPTQSFIVLAVPENVAVSSAIVYGIYCYAYGDYFENNGEEQTHYSLSSAKGEEKTIRGNELIQTQSTWEGNSLSTAIYNKFSTYGDGRECVVLECDFLPSKTPLKIGDTVCPYVIRNGKTVPFLSSETDDVDPRDFLVVGVKYTYNGVPKQQLYLQEI